MEAENKIFVKNRDIPSCTECVQDIFLGFFFDGTNNNKFRDTAGFSHSNVARLYEAFIGTPARQQPPKLTPKVVGWDAQGNPRKQERTLFPDQAFRPAGFPAREFSYYRKIYVPGVGTPFPEVGDTGTGVDKTAGLAMALHGEARIDWAMLQVCNQIHAALTGQAICDSFDVGFKTPSARPKDMLLYFADLDAEVTRQLDVLDAALAKTVSTRVRNKPTLRRIRLSVFGFSRGAAEARAFVNRVNGRWGSRIAGLSLTLDFLGLFDTVASVGPAQSVPGAHGHSAWADGEKLVVPPVVKRCVHLISAHEVRASFPLDSVCQSGALPFNAKEIVYPGMHSDVGGGYPPGDQGRSLGDGAAGDCRKLSQVPLAQMYREARMAGVPLGTPKQMPMETMRNFAVDPQLRADFNAYVEATRTGRVPPTNGKGVPAYAELFPTEEQPRHALETLIFTHYAHFLQWHKQLLGNAHTLPGLQANPNVTKHQDIEDIRGADEELQKEIRFLEDRNPGKFNDVDDPAIELALNVSVPAQGYLAVKKAVLQAMHEKQRQWDYALKDVWYGAPVLTGNRAADARKLFECYVHDSRAWFKALLSRVNLNSESRIALLQSLMRMRSYQMAPDDEDWFTLGERDKERNAQIAALEKTLEKQKAVNDSAGQKKSEAKLALLRQQGPLIRGGREPYRMYGYLRHRKVYQSGQIDGTAHAQRMKVIQQDEKDRSKQQRIDEEINRYQKERKKILENNRRVITDQRYSDSQRAEYNESSKFRLKHQDELHATTLKNIHAEH